MITITLNKIKAHDPCQDGWKTLLASKGKTKADNVEFPLIDVLDSNGLDDALWCLRCLPEHNDKWRLLAVSFARGVEHLMQDKRSINALEVAERHARGKATDEELRDARHAAWHAAIAAIAAKAVARTAAKAVASAAASAAEKDAAWHAAIAAWHANDAAWYANGVSAGVAARAKQENLLRAALAEAA